MRKSMIYVCTCLTIFCFFSCDTRELPPPWELQPFYQAIERNDMDMVQAYMKKYKHIANFELANILGLGPFRTNTVTTAVMSGNMDMLELMVKERPSVNLQTYPNGFTALHLAIQMQRKDMIEYLLDHNADVTIVDDSGYNVFHYIAMYYRDTEVFHLFSEYTTKLINQKQEDGYPPLVFLISNQYDDEQYEAPGVLEFLQLFLDNGADVSLLFEDMNAFDPFYQLIRGHKNDYLKLILSYTHQKIPNRKNGVNYLHTSIYFRNFELVPLFIPLVQNINDTNEHGQTPLHYAASVAGLDIIQILLENGADKTLKDDNGMTAYDLYITDNPDIDEDITSLLKVE